MGRWFGGPQFIYAEGSDEFMKSLLKSLESKEERKTGPQITENHLHIHLGDKRDLSEEEENQLVIDVLSELKLITNEERLLLEGGRCLDYSKQDS